MSEGDPAAKGARLEGHVLAVALAHDEGVAHGDEQRCRTHPGSGTKGRALRAMSWRSRWLMMKGWCMVMNSATSALARQGTVMVLLPLSTLRMCVLASGVRVMLVSRPACPWASQQDVIYSDFSVARLAVCHPSVTLRLSTHQHNDSHGKSSGAWCRWSAGCTSMCACSQQYPQRA